MLTCMRFSVVVGVAFVTISGCRSAPVIWEEPVSAPADSSARLQLTPDGAPVVASLAKPAGFPRDEGLCPSTLVTARDEGAWYAAWLSRRPDGAVIVRAAKSADSGRSWSRPGTVDSVDVGRTGCTHPPPSIAASAGYVHVAYSIEAPEGYGVFFAHSMDGTATFHSPAPVIYGDRLSRAAVAADGMRVAVAYEDPSGDGHRVEVAPSLTQGHTFDRRMRVSPDEMSAIDPEIAVRGTAVALSFGSPTGGPRTMRVGHFH